MKKTRQIADQISCADYFDTGADASVSAKAASASGNPKPHAAGGRFTD
jgi:hypothetical protein